MLLKRRFFGETWTKLPQMAMKTLIIGSEYAIMWLYCDLMGFGKSTMIKPGITMVFQQ
jgi:hypothetical protein